MFHEGGIHSGIATALQESKCFICFVEDDTPESSKWATEWMLEPEVAQPLEERAVAIRIASGSSEATDFAAFCPIERTPTLAVIFQGRLIQQLNPGVSKEDFTNRLLKALERKSRPETTSPSEHYNTTQSSTSPPTQPPSSQNSVHSVLEERRTRLEADRKAKEAAEKAREVEKRERERQRRQQLDAADPGRSDYVREQAQRKKEAAKDRERVKALIEEDKARRKEEKDLKRRAAEEQASHLNGGTATSDQIYNTEEIKTPETHTMSSIQVRLFDGSTLRAPFETKSTLQDIRLWVDSTRDDGKEAYHFKEIRTPQPSRNIDPRDESKNFYELGLLRNASLALIPSESATASTHGVLGRAAQYTSMLIWLIFQWFGTLFDRLRGTSHPADEQQAEERTQAAGASTGVDQTQRDGRSIRRIRTLNDQHSDKEDNKFYNGNQLNFEPNTLDSDEDKKT